MKESNQIRKKLIEGYENYSIMENGIVTNESRGTICKWQPTKGYVRVSLSKKRKLKGFLVHRLLAIYFIPNPDNKPEVNHINGIKTDNRLENLEWCTKSENKLHSIRIGTTKVIRGTKYYSAKFTEHQVRSLRSIENINYKEQADIYGVDPPVIWNLVNRKTYKDVI